MVSMRVAAFYASPRKNGNSTIMLKELLRGTKEEGALVEEFNASELNLNYCRGCLRCNLLGRCTIRNDDWQRISSSILESDRLVFASPVYFHHIAAPLKKLIDRFRSFLHVSVTESGLEHRPWQNWKKEFILLLSLGSSDASDAEPVIELFRFMVKCLGESCRLTVVVAPRLIVPGQIVMEANQLEVLYRKLGLSEHLALIDSEHYRKLLDRCYRIGRTLP